MKKNITITIVLLIIIFFPFVTINAADSSSFDTGDCIKNFGEITFVNAGSNNDAGGKAVFSNKTNNTSWNTDPVSFDVEVQATSYHKVKTIHYSINSKDGYSCTGVVSGSTIENNQGSVKLHVVINKGWVNDMAFWGKSVNRTDSTKSDVTKSNLINVKREMTDEELEEIDEDLNITTGDKLECSTLSDFLDKYWSWVMILMPVATMVLITLDLVNPIISSDTDALKKAGNKALKRTVALVILLILPVIINILFGLFDIETCF